MTGQLDRLIYMDDSGHPASGLVVYGWVEIAPDTWSEVLGTWLDLRKRLWRDFGIPVTRELHSTKYIHGRSNVTTRAPERFVVDGTLRKKELGQAVAEECLETLRSTRGLRIGAVYRSDPNSTPVQTRQRLYSALVHRFEEELARTGSYALIFMDGDGSDQTYRTTHRHLDRNRRRVIEDAIHLDSAGSQLIQMADLVAWSANVAVAPHEKNQFAREWYGRFLAERDPDRSPQQL